MSQIPDSFFLMPLNFDAGTIPLKSYDLATNPLFILRSRSTTNFNLETLKMKGTIAILFVFILTIILFGPVSAHSATVLVPDDEPTIQAGIDAADDGDTVLVADGVYTGNGNKNIDFKGKAIAVQSRNGANNCIIDCEGSGRGFYFHSGEGNDSVVYGFTLTNGSVDVGGGVCCENSHPTISNMRITESTASDRGGGIHCWYASPIISRCDIEANTGDERGAGGIMCYHSSPTITGCNIKNNTSNSYGGGLDVFWRSHPKIINCVISGNIAIEKGGGIAYWNDSSPIITNCTISRNAAGEEGGGIWNWIDAASITNCIIWDNSPNQLFSNDIDLLNVTYCDVQGGFAGTGNINADPLCIGGGDYHLSALSPCINSGQNNAPDLPTTDKDGNPRIIDGIVDMGPYEVGLSFVSKNGECGGKTHVTLRFRQRLTKQTRVPS